MSVNFLGGRVATANRIIVESKGFIYNLIISVAGVYIFVFHSYELSRGSDPHGKYFRFYSLKKFFGRNYNQKELLDL